VPESNQVSSVGIEELSTRNVSEPKTTTVNNGPRAEGTFLTGVMSGKVCGDSLCDRPMTVKEKLEMYLLEKFETIVIEKALKTKGFGAVLDVPDFDRGFIPTHATESLPDRGTPEMESIKDALEQTFNTSVIDRAAGFTAAEFDEKLKELSTNLVLEMYRADAASDLGDWKETVEHLKEMKSIFKEIKKLQIIKAEMEQASVETVMKWLEEHKTR